MIPDDSMRQIATTRHREMTMTPTALTAKEVMRLKCGLASAGLGRPDLPVLLLDPSARQALAEVLACRDVLPPVPARPTLVMRAWAWLATLARRLSRPPGHATIGRAVAASESPVVR